jgi:hypothetical protein
MRRVSRICALITVIFIILAGTVSAVDFLYRMLNADDDNFAQAQDAMVVGEILSATPGTYRVKTLKTITGENVPDEFTLQTDDFYFNIPNETPEAGEYAVLPLKALSEAGSYALSYSFMCRADSADYTALRLYIPKESLHVLEIKAIEVYVNSGGLLRDFGFDGLTGTLTVYSSKDQRVVYEFSEEDLYYAVGTVPKDPVPTATVKPSPSDPSLPPPTPTPVVPVPDGDDNLSYETKVTIIIVCCVLITTMALFFAIFCMVRKKK